jgi:GTPase
MFVDRVSVFISAGTGGSGAVSFRHEKYIDKGGPDGGDGGKGGDVIVVGSNRQNTLASFRYQREIKAKDGERGSKRKRHGKSADNLEILVPVGTVVYGPDNELLADITEEDQKVIIAKGGKGGFGNAHFVSSRRQTPRVAEKGEPGQEFEAVMELKLIAEVGLVGLPNAGKSTLLSRISNAKPEIANYPFTTTVPNLGVAKINDDKSLLVADIPGLIEGASEGKGLGDEFLRHVERTKVLIHLVDAYSSDIAKDYNVIRKELSAYKIDLSNRPEIVAISKIEGLDQDIIDDLVKQLNKKVKKGTKVLAISSQSGEGLKELMSLATKYVDKISTKKAKKIESEIPVITLKESDKHWNVSKIPKGFLVSGKSIERFASKTDFNNFAGVDRLRDIMRKNGIMHELERAKIKPGDKIIFGEKQTYGPLEY